MLQVTSARHVLNRDPAAAEEALRSAEDVGRRSMQELRRTVGLLRSDDRPGVLAPVASASEIPALVDDARAGGLAVELRVRGDVAVIAPSVGLGVYRIAQEALANAARHAPRARTVLGLDVDDAHVCLVAETIGPVLRVVEGEAQRSRYGVIGMRERAAALGGELTAGPIPGGWRVSCRLPLRTAGEQAPGRRLIRSVRRFARLVQMIRVALVDDQAIVRAGLARILSPQDGFEVVAECADGRQAVDELPALAPEVVLMDIRMPVLDGIAATAALARSQTRSPCLC